MGSLSLTHWLVVIIVVLVLFGPGRLAGVGKGLGQGLRGFKKSLSDPSPNDEKPTGEAPRGEG